jgi:hypothetical protein
VKTSWPESSEPTARFISGGQAMTDEEVQDLVCSPKIGPAEMGVSG